MTGARIALSKVCAVIALGLGMSSIISYATGVPGALMWTDNKIPMALSTALSVTLLSTAILLTPNK